MVTIDSLSARAVDITERNNVEPGVEPPLFAAQDPLQEILLRDVTARLPRELQLRAAKAQMWNDVSGWLVLGAVMDLVNGDDHLRSELLRGLAEPVRPTSIVMSLASAIGRRAVPPPRSIAWRRVDVLGAALELLLAALLVMVRCILISLLYGSYAAAWWPLASVTPTGWRFGLRWIAALGGVLCWTSLEMGVGVWLLEHVRRLPARCVHLPPPLSWRLDLFHVLWLAQSLVTASLLLLRFIESSHSSP